MAGQPEDVAEPSCGGDDRPPVHNLSVMMPMLIDLYQQGSIEAWLPVAVSFAESWPVRATRSQAD